MERVWHQHYDEGVPPDVPATTATVVDSLYASAERFG